MADPDRLCVPEIEPGHELQEGVAVGVSVMTYSFIMSLVPRAYCSMVTSRVALRDYEDMPSSAQLRLERWVQLVSNRLKSD